MIQLVMDPKRPVGETHRPFRSAVEGPATVESGAVLTVSELSDYLRVRKAKIYRLLRTGGIPGFKIGSDWRFNKEVIDRWKLSAAGGGDD
jgi:excisionase family DNA binding protein